MPIYEYRCLDCGHEFELMQRFSDPPAESCPACPGRVQKLISRSAFHLKGDGWYVTDYARKTNSNGTKSANESGDSKPDSKSDSAPNKTSSEATTASSTKNTTTSTTTS